MTVRPIIFSAPMARALLDGRKTQTRRLLKPRKGVTLAEVEWEPHPSGMGKIGRVPLDKLIVPFAPGDLLWVREGFSPRYHDDGSPGYRADWSKRAAEVAGEPKWKPAIHMPRWASRLTLRVTGVKVERLQDISEEDAIAEGIERLKSGRGFYDPRYGHGHVHFGYFHTARGAFDALWGAINGPASWPANPWVVALTFETIKQNVDALSALSAMEGQST